MATLEQKNPSQHQQNQSVFRQSFELFLKTALTLLPFFLLLNWCESLLTRAVQTLMSSRDGAPPWIWLLVIASVFLSLLGPLVITFSALSKLHGRVGSLSQCAAEQIRAMGSVLLWTLALLIPGLIRFLQLIFVPFVCFLDKTYQDGKVDALKASKIIFKKCWGRTLLLALIFSAIIPMGMTLFDSVLTLDDWFYDKPLAAFAVQSVELYFSILSVLLLKNLWEKNHVPVF